MPKETKIRITTTDGDIIIDDIQNSACLDCIRSKCNEKGFGLVECPLENQLHKRLFHRSGTNGTLDICDDKEKSRANFSQLAEMLFHHVKNLVAIQKRIQTQEIERIDSDITVFKHNIETINGESIREFESAVSVRNLRNKYKEIVSVVEEVLESDARSMSSFIARQALNNQRIQTELFVSKIIGGSRYETKSTISNPWDAIMTNIYLLYPLAIKQDIELIIGEYYEKFQIDYNALKVASYYIIDNAIKYARSGSKVNIEFFEEDGKLRIDFKMKSPVILECERETIFEKGIRGRNAKLLNVQGSGYGLFCARKLLKLAYAEIEVNPGVSCEKRNGIEYAINVFSIILDKTMTAWK